MKCKFDIYRFLTLLVCVMILFSCKPSVPRKYIRPGKMEDILYDFFLADAMAMNGKDYNQRQKQRLEYRMSVLKKYNVTQSEFDSSLVYYFRHSDRLKDIFQDVSKRMSDEALALGSSVNDLNLYGTDATAGDTATVWRASRTCVLLPNRGENVVSFRLDADTAYYPGDKLTLQMDAEYIIQEGMKDGVALLAVTLKNDSVIKQIQHLSSNTSYNLQIADKSHEGIKQVKGFVALLQGQKTKNTSTMRVLSLSRLRLVRMHEKDEETNEDEKVNVKADSSTVAAHNTTSNEENGYSKNNMSNEIKRNMETTASDTSRRKAFFGKSGSKIKPKER